MSIFWELTIRCTCLWTNLHVFSGYQSFEQKFVGMAGKCCLPSLNCLIWLSQEIISPIYMFVQFSQTFFPKLAQYDNVLYVWHSISTCFHVVHVLMNFEYKLHVLSRYQNFDSKWRMTNKTNIWPKLWSVPEWRRRVILNSNFFCETIIRLFTHLQSLVQFERPKEQAILLVQECIWPVHF